MVCLPYSPAVCVPPSLLIEAGHSLARPVSSLQVSEFALLLPSSPQASLHLLSFVSFLMMIPCLNGLPWRALPADTVCSPQGPSKIPPFPSVLGGPLNSREVGKTTLLPLISLQYELALLGGTWDYKLRRCFYVQLCSLHHILSHLLVFVLSSSWHCRLLEGKQQVLQVLAAFLFSMQCLAQGRSPQIITDLIREAACSQRAGNLSSYWGTQLTDHTWLTVNCTHLAFVLK